MTNLYHINKFSLYNLMFFADVLDLYKNIEYNLPNKILPNG